MAIGSGRNRISGQGKPSVDAMNDESTANGVTAEVVSDYLREHPDFFNQHPHVLGELKISHVGDGAVSLVERHDRHLGRPLATPFRRLTMRRATAMEPLT